ncbi:hypothetical protein SAMN04488028_1024 [Reichenbachiella agariperforans]|uniref:Uncharacterized protein n=1 Tax=Reichenbachiella agariperforans TaxID=156994 RepID=A0A1M6MY54_REIAG|nr:hypothetical protein SAMN04488028_1024 [Reichenbachiella agariperforans]
MLEPRQTPVSWSVAHRPYFDLHFTHPSFDEARSELFYIEYPILTPVYQDTTLP